MLSDLVESLAAQGMPICVLTSRLRYDRPGELLPARATWQGAQVRRLWSTRFGRANLFGRMLDYLSFYLSAVIAVARHARRGDVLVALTDPPMIGTVLQPIARLRGVRVVHWMQDIFPEVAQALLPAARRLPLLGLVTAWRNYTLRRAAHVVVLGERMQERVHQMGVAADRVSVIPNWADEQLLKPVARADNPLRREWGLGDDLVIGYSGNLGRAHEFETLVQAIVLTKDQPGLRFLFIGQGAQLSPLKQRIAALNLLHRVRFEDYQPREMLHYSLSAADVHLVSLQPELEGLIVPSKLYGALAVGRPVIFIGDPDGEVARVLRRHECGQTVTVSGGAALAKALVGYLSSALHLRHCDAARYAFTEAYTRSHAAQAWASHMTSVNANGYPTTKYTELK